MSWDRIGRDLRTRRIIILGCRKSPTFTSQVPVNRCIWYDGLEALEGADDQCAVCPWTSIRDLQTAISELLDGIELIQNIHRGDIDQPLGETVLPS
jgi:hypothetical protein